MATEQVRDYADTIIGDAVDTEDANSNTSAETVIRGPDSLSHLGTTSSYIVADQSVFSRDVDQWINGNARSATDSGTHSTRVPTAQRSTLVTSASLENNGVWYLAAMVLPFLGANNTILWRCTPSTVLTTAELVLSHMAHLCGRARFELRRLANEAHEQATAELLATSMDILLVIYAIGFLVLSMYQASLIGA